MVTAATGMIMSREHLQEDAAPASRGGGEAAGDGAKCRAQMAESTADSCGLAGAPAAS